MYTAYWSKSLCCCCSCYCSTCQHAEKKRRAQFSEEELLRVLVWLVLRHVNKLGPRGQKPKGFDWLNFTRGRDESDVFRCLEKFEVSLLYSTLYCTVQYSSTTTVLKNVLLWEKCLHFSFLLLFWDQPYCDLPHTWICLFDSTQFRTPHVIYGKHL